MRIAVPNPILPEAEVKFTEPAAPTLMLPPPPLLMLPPTFTVTVLPVEVITLLLVNDPVPVLSKIRLAVLVSAALTVMLPV